MNIYVIFKIASIGIITAIVGMLLKKAGKDELATVVSIIGLIVSVVMMLDMVAQLYDTITSLFDF